MLYPVPRKVFQTNLKNKKGKSTESSVKSWVFQDCQDSCSPTEAWDRNDSMLNACSLMLELLCGV